MRGGAREASKAAPGQRRVKPNMRWPEELIEQARRGVEQAGMTFTAATEEAMRDWLLKRSQSSPPVAGR
jgi:hypothetical protein